MSDTNTTPAAESPTKVSFDLAAILTPNELERFQQAAAEAGAPTLTEHFLNLTLRMPERPAA